MSTFCLKFVKRRLVYLSNISDARGRLPILVVVFGTVGEEFGIDVTSSCGLFNGLPSRSASGRMEDTGGKFDWKPSSSSSGSPSKSLSKTGSALFIPPVGDRVMFSPVFDISFSLKPDDQALIAPTGK